MKPHTFDEIVKAKAEADAQTAISQFQDAVSRAIEQLLCGYTGEFSVKRDLNIRTRKVLEVLLLPKKDRKWPRAIWERRRERISESIIAQLDSVQKAMVATGRNAEGDEKSDE